MIEPIEKTRHCFFIGLLDISSDHCNLHVLGVPFDGLGPLLENMELLEEVVSIMRRHKSNDLPLHPKYQWGFLLVLVEVVELVPSIRGHTRRT